MLNNQSKETESTGSESQKHTISPPAISLPKGGGAIRGIGEKFAANPVTGTGSMSVPIATSPGRSGFGPQLSLSYDSGAGNGPFGFGWSLSLPSITRKTDKGLPKYLDAVDSDVFILSGAEDLVPEFEKDAAGKWIIKDGKHVVYDKPRIVNNETYNVRRYRPRIEGLFARIERWTNPNKPDDSFWRSISRDNITTWYGRTENSRITDTVDPTHIFSWLICESYDDKGNVIVYRYKKEDSENVDITQVNESNRTTQTRKANRYLKTICYGNREPYLPKLTPTAWPQPPDLTATTNPPNYFFEVVFDYEDGHYTEVKPDAEGRIFARPVYKPPTSAKWAARVDPFSTYRSGFEVRTYRLCQRVLMFHHFPGRNELGIPDYLVRSTDFTYSYENYPNDARNPIYSFVDSVSQSGYVRQANGSYLKKSLPPLQFEYTKPQVQAEVHDVDPVSLENLPYGLDGSNYQWVDLDGEGLSGILTEQGDAWFYKRNLSPLPIKTNGKEEVNAHFAPLELVAKKPSLAALSAGGQQFLDLAGDGQLDLVAFGGPTPGFFERTQDEDWEPFKTFRSLPNVDWSNPHLKFVDLTGDGHADILITEDNVFWWYPSLAEDGFGPAERVPQKWDEEKGPRLVFADAEHSIHLGDLSGDGLSDLVRIRNGEVCYWPNLGYGRFGAKVTMDNSPWFDNPDQFDPRRIQLADIDGSGTTDSIYIGANGVDLYFNQSGNGWSKAHHLDHYPQTDSLSSVTAMDLLGNGTACLVWSSPLPGNARRPMRYIDLMGGIKPHLMIKTRNNLGATTEVQYAPSTKFYVEDKLAGKPWITKIPFPVHVVEKTINTDDWRKTEFSTSYSYHHGYYDGIEKEFRGFGRVEQIDVEDYGPFKIRNKNNPYLTDDDTLYQPPVKTVTWFHTGAFLDRKRILSQFEGEYFPTWYEALDPTKKNVLGQFLENQLPEPDLDAQDLSTDEWRGALRACKGMTLRQEIYELSVKDLNEKRLQPVKLFSTAYHNCQIQRLQPKAQNQPAVFLVAESEAITYHYELDLPAAPGDLTPDPRIAHTLNLRTDDFGNVLQSVSVVYPRIGRHKDSTLLPGTENLIANVQRELHLAYTENRFTKELSPDLDNHRLPAPCEVLTYELTGIRPEDDDDRRTTDRRDNLYFTVDELRPFRLSEVHQTQGSAVGRLEYHQQPDRKNPEKRLVEHVRVLYFKENLTDPETLGVMNRFGIHFETYNLALTKDLLTAAFGSKLTAEVRAKLTNPSLSGYLSGADMQARFGNQSIAGQHWIRSGIAGFNVDARQHFYLPERYIDPFGQLNNGNVTRLNYDPGDLYIESSIDALGNTVTVTRFDFRVLAPRELQDPNDNYSSVAFDVLGMPVASAMMGKNRTESGDNLSNVETNLTVKEIAGFFTAGYVVSIPRGWLGNATARYVYDLGESLENGKITYGHRPGGTCSILREKHVNQLHGGENKIQVGVEYSDGSGNVLVKKAQAEPDSTVNTELLRWIASGKTMLNNKGKPVKQYEPYYSDTEHTFDETEAQREVGVTPIMYYDAPGRLMRTELPDGSFSRVEFSPWHVTTYDQNDTAFDLNPTKQSDWYKRRTDPNHLLFVKFNTPEDQRAAELVKVHANTPLQVFLDSLGRDVLNVAHNKYDAQGTLNDEKYVTFTKLDAEGKPLWIRDARGNLVMQYITPFKPTRWADDSSENIPAAAVPCYDIAGNLLYQHSMDAGDRWMINDAAGKPMFAWDLNDQGPGSPLQARSFRTDYDALHRPISQWLKIDAAKPALIEAFEYCDANQPNGAADIDDARTRNLIGQAVKHWDPSGLATVERIDLSGKPAHVTRDLIRPDSDGGTGVLNWDIANRNTLLESEIFHQITEYDALGRMILLYNWHRDITFGANGAAQATPGATNRVAVYEPTYNERGALISEWLHVRATKLTAQDGRVRFTADTQRTQQAIKGITYNEKGQKLSLKLGNDTTTRYTYDPYTFRLIHLYTRRNGNAFTGDCTSNTADDRRPQRPCGMQNLHYTYDPVGNITHIQDDAQQTIYFSNSAVEPSNDYTYDALYRLIEATGRENAAAVAPPRNREEPWPTNGFPSADALRNYTQHYSYDAVGNFVEIKHLPRSGNGWTRHYRTQPDSNRLAQTWYGGNTITAVTYHYDAHGSMLNLNRVETPPPLDQDEQWGLDIRWDWRDMIRGFDLGGGGQAYYQYDAEKQRTRKRVERNGTGIEDRIYLGGYELYRRTVADAVVEQIESHHLFEGEQRILLMDDVITPSSQADPRPDGLTVKAQTLFRYQYSNHLGSACLELDHAAEIISYEEYHPYGTSAYRAVKSGIEAPAQRYRYTGMERDEETALNYQTARYYVPTLTRWASCDPAGPKDAANCYLYVSASPSNYRDGDGLQQTPGYFAQQKPEKGFFTDSWNRLKQDASDFWQWLPPGPEDKTGPPSPPTPIEIAQPSPRELPTLEWHPAPDEFDRQVNELKVATMGVAVTLQMSMEATEFLFPAAVLLPVAQSSSAGRKAAGLSMAELNTASLLDKGNFLSKEAIARGLQLEAEILQSRLLNLGGKTGQVYQRQSTIAVFLHKDSAGNYRKYVSGGGLEVPDITSKSKLAKALDLANPPEIVGTTSPLTALRLKDIRSGLASGVKKLDAEQKYSLFISNPKSVPTGTPVAGGVSRNICHVCSYGLYEVGGAQNSSRQIIFPYDPR